KPAVPVLTEVLKGKNKDAQTYAIGALAGIGPEAKAAIPALMEVFRERLDDIAKRMEVGKGGDGIGRFGKGGGRPGSINSSESPHPIIQALLSIDPAIRDVLPRDLLEFNGPNSWEEVYQALSEKYGPRKK